MIYLLTAIGLSPGGSSTVHICTQTIHRTSQKFWKYVGRAPFGELYSGLTTEKKARKNLEARKILRLNHTIKLCNISAFLLKCSAHIRLNGTLYVH